MNKLCKILSLQIMLVGILIVLLTIGIGAASPVVSSVVNASVTLEQYSKYTLPSTLTVKLSDNTKKTLPVTWEKQTINTSKLGVFTYKFSIKQYSYKDSFVVNVVSKANKLIFINPEVENQILITLKRTGGIVTKSDIPKITRFVPNNTFKDNDLSDLKMFTEIVEIDLVSFNISDISFLSNSHKLTYLLLENNNIENIEVLKNCPNLEVLDISFNKIEDISSLKHLKKLETLLLKGNFIEDFSSIKNYYLSLLIKDFDVDKEKVITQEIKRIIDLIITKDMSDFEKEIAVHDYIINNTNYDNMLKPESYTVYGLLTNKEGVCQAYAETFKLFMTKIGIENYIVTGTADKTAHAWNIVSLDGNLYHVDCTWDDAGKNMKPSHRYFNLSDDQLSKNSHQWDRDTPYKCTSIKYNYKYYMASKNNGLDINTLKTIGGIVSLPNGDVAPKGGLTFTVYVSENSKKYDDSQTIIIPEGKSSASYQITVPDFKEFFVYLENFNDLNYTGYCYYGINGIVMNSSEKAYVKAGDSNVNFQLLKNYKITGKIMLPQNELAPKGGLSISLSASNNSEFDVNITYVIPEGKNSVEYTIPVDPFNSEYILQYTVQSDYYCNVGYYAGTTMVSSLKEATPIKVNGPVSQINLTIISGNIISGNISLPTGQKAPKGGIQLEIYAVDSNGTPDDSDNIVYSSYFTIPEGLNSTKFSIATNKSERGYKVYYFIKFPSMDDLCKRGYWSKNGTTENEYKYDLIANSKNLELNILKKVAIATVNISGKVSLPNGTLAPKGGIELEIIARSDNRTKEDYTDDYQNENLVVIPEGQNSITYSIPVRKMNSGYYVHYLYEGDDDSYYSMGTYSVSGTVDSNSKATTVEPDTGKSIDLVVLLLLDIIG